MSVCVYSVGSNLGDRAALLQGAVDQLRPWLQAVSPVYATPPWGPVPQGEFLNAVLICADEVPARVWLQRAQRIEDSAGRTRDLRWGPRTLDVDVIDVQGALGSEASDDPELTLPHPRAAVRAFVLVPWLAVQPDARLSGRPVGELIAGLPDEEVSAVRQVEVTLR